MESMDADGHSRGILTAWSPLLNLISLTRHESMLETKLKDIETRIYFTILNVYGPFYNIKDYWETFENSSTRRKSNVILGGYLNLTLTMSEVWGENARQDALSSFSTIFFEHKKLVDVLPLKMEPK